MGVKVVLPAYIIVSLLTYTPVIGWISDFLAPLMQVLGLPGEAALPIVLAALVNSYAGVGAVVPLGLDAKELTIVAAMVLIAHDLPIEAAISKKSGSRIIPLILVRIILAILVALAINIIM